MLSELAKKLNWNKAGGLEAESTLLMPQILFPSTLCVEERFFPGRILEVTFSTLAGLCSKRSGGKKYCKNTCVKEAVLFYSTSLLLLILKNASNFRRHTVCSKTRLYIGICCSICVL